MVQFKKGDIIYFSSVATLVNEGVVEAVEGPYIKINTKTPGVEYVMASQAFKTREELRSSEAYHNAWMQQQTRRYMREPMGRMAAVSFW